VTVPLLLAERIAVVPVDPPFARRLLAGEPDPERPWAPGFPLATARPAFRLVLEAERAGGTLAPFGVGVVQRLADGVLIGDAGYHGPPAGDGEVEIGYALVPAARGEGLGGEVARVLTEFALSHRSVRAVTARVEPGNERSVRVLERLGFVPDGRRDALLRYVLRAPQRR
jgi:RimJ/RimL family protein N-acetyltransferase